MSKDVEKWLGYLKLIGIKFDNPYKEQKITKQIKEMKLYKEKTISTNIDEEVTQAEMIVAYAKYKPNFIIRFYCRFFSRDTKDKDKILKLLIVSISGFGILFGMLGAILSSQIIMVIGALITGSILIPLVAFGFYAFKVNQIRIKKICKELGIEPDMYNQLVVKYYEQIIT